MKKDLGEQKLLTSLPTETLQLVASFLPTQQRFTLLYVCRALSYQCFWRSLYTEIHINDDQHYNKFITTITRSAMSTTTRSTKCNSFIPNLGYYVEILTVFFENIIMNKKTVGVLQQLCPNMTYFDTSHVRHPLPTTLPKALPWKNIERISSSLYSDVSLVSQQLYNQLTHMSIRDLYTGDSSTIFGGSSTSCLLSFPHLVDLIIGPTEELSINMLTNIITACPSLQHFTLDAVTLPKLRSDEISDWNTITPLVSIKHLELLNVHTDELLWFKILGYVFPMVETLTIQYLHVFAPVPVMGDDTVVINNSDDDREFMEDNNFDVATLRKAFLDLLDTWTHMGRAQLLNISYNDQNLGGYFLLNHWIANGKQLQDLQFDYSCKDDGTLEDINFIDTEVRGDPHDDFSDYEYGSQLAAMGEHQSAIVIDFINSTRNNLRTFHFYVNHALFESQRNILNTLAGCPWLHTLVLRFTDDMCGYYDMETINVILDTLPQLKSLEYPTALASEPDVERDYLDAYHDLSSESESESSSKPRHRRRRRRPPFAPHGLTRLVYNGEVRVLGFLGYIHDRCPDLRVLHLDARQNNDGGCTLATFKHWNLQELDIGSSGGVNKDNALVVISELAYTPKRTRLYEHTTNGWRLRTNIPDGAFKAGSDSSDPSDHPDLILTFNSIEQIQLFTPSPYHHVF